MWQILCVISLVFLIMEIFLPAFFFLNLAISALITAGISLFVSNINIILLIFVLISFVTLAFIRPLLLKSKNNKSTKTGIEEKYIGNIAKVVDTITKTKGVITIYGERWEARLTDSEALQISEIPKDSQVKIVKNKSLIMYVERIGE